MQKLLIILFLFGFCVPIMAQKISIQKIDAGKFNFAKGEIQVSFNDTISPAFVEQQFSKFGYEIIEMNILPIRGFIYSEIPDSTFDQILKHPYIQGLNTVSHSFPEKAFQEMLDRDNKKRTKEEIQALRERFEKMTMRKTTLITFKYDINKAKAEVFKEQFPHIKMNIMSQPRTAVVRTEVGNESEIMKKLNPLIYVTGTAFIAILD